MKNSTCKACAGDEKDKKKTILSLSLLLWGTVLLIAGYVLERMDPSGLSLTWNSFGTPGFFSSYSFVAFLLYTLGYIPLSLDMAWGAFRETKEGAFFNEFSLMLIATLGAYAIAEFPETLLVILLYIVGEMLEDYATEKSSASIKKLINNAPLFAHEIQKDGSIQNKDPETIPVGSRLEVRPGEKIAIDGTIVQGETTCDLSSLNGESMPRDFKVGDSLYSGSINLTSLIVIQTTKAYPDSMLSKIMALVETEQKKKAKSEKFITRFSKIYTPIVILVAVLVFLVGFGVSGWQWSIANGGKDWLYKALSVLLISCPCSLVISVPIAFFAGIGTASRIGILIKGSLPLETLAHSNAFVFDKTGTLTEGEFTLKATPDPEMLQLAASLESKSTHPLGKALIKANVLPLLDVTSFTVRNGYGIQGIIKGKTYLLGSQDFLRQNGVSDVQEVVTPFKALYLGEAHGRFLTSFIVADTIKPQAQKALQALKKEGGKTLIMLSGDDEAIAHAVGKEVGTDVALGSLLPEEKLGYVKQYAATNTLCYVGDGINDSPALLAADVGIAMGALGSDAAIEASDIVIMDDKLTKIPEGKRIAKQTMALVIENIIFALTVKTLVMILVMAGYADGFAMILGTLCDTGVMVLCLLNALRLMRYRPKYLDEKSVLKK